MHNLFHYERENNPAYNCANVLEKWDVVKNEDLLGSALDEYFRGLLVLRPNRKPTQAPGAWWRITIPFWALAYVLLAFVVLPVRWLITGQYLLSHKGRAFRWFRTWHQLIFPWPKP